MGHIFENEKGGGRRIMKWSSKGAKDNTIRLAWSKYYKYVVENEEYYFKQKAYTTYCDGWITSERIKKQTYKNAIKRGNGCIEISLEKQLSEASVEYLTLIYSEKYSLSKDQMKKIILKATETIENIKKSSTMGTTAEYKIFIRIVENNSNKIKKGEKI